MRYVWPAVVCAVIVWQFHCRHSARDTERPHRPEVPSSGPVEASPDGDEPVADRSAPAGPLRIGTWNLRRLGHGKKRMDWVAGVVEQSFDVVALQEVMNPEGVHQLVARLPGWRAEVSSKAVGTDHYEEWYAVLYRTGRVSTSRSFIMGDRKDALVREPFVVCLQAGAADFCLVNVHIIFGKRAAARDEEIHVLGEKVQRLRSRGPEKDWIVLGDFNRSPRARGWGKLRASGWDFTLPERTPTTLGKRGYASPYDHILIDGRYTSEISSDARRIDILQEPCAGDLETCRTTLSDHAPLVVEFAVDGEDDD